MINRIFKNRFFLLFIQFFTLFVFILIIYGSIGVYTEDKDFAKILRNTNFPNLIVWSYWWPFIIVSAIIFGRFWCTVCPVELVTSFFGKIGFRKKPGSFLKSGWIITLFYSVILILGIHTLAIHRIPQYMAFYMILLFLTAVITGLIWEKRTFCTYVCPIGHLLGLYSLLSFKKLRVINADVCKNCKTKDCISKTNHYKLIGRSCTSELYPATISDNRDCILCGQCHKSCTKDNIAVQKRKFGADLFSDIKLSWAEMSFFMIVSSFVIYEILSEWKVSKKIIMSAPDYVNNLFTVQGNLTGTVKAVVLFLIFPFVFYLFFAFAKKTLGKETLKNSINQLVIAILPITASMHLLKAILKTTSRIPYWKFVFSDPKGIKTAQIISENSNFLDKTFLNSISPIIGIAALLLSVGGIVFSLSVIRKINFNSKFSKFITILAVLIYSGLFLITIIARRFF